MHKLIINEIMKIFHKKSIFIIWGIMFVFCLLNNILYKIDYDEEGQYKFSKKENIAEEIIRLEKDLSKYNLNDMVDFSLYVSLKTKLDLYKIKQEFPKDSWQYNKIEDYLYEYLYQKNYYTYQEKNAIFLNNANIEFQKNYEYLRTNHWLYFLQLETKKLEIEKLELEEKKKNILNEVEQLSYLKRQKEIQDELEILNYRIKKHILYDNSYLNKALLNYQDSLSSIRYYENLERKNTDREKYQYQESLKTNKISLYIIENQKNINQENTLNYQLRTIVEDYELFIVIFILMVSSIVICDEFHNGTVKLLLIKPYSRGKILISKYFATIVMLVITILFLISMQILIGGMIFGLESLTDPVVVYCYNTKELINYSVFEYMWIRIFAKLPFFFILSLICISVGIMVTNTVVAMMLPLLLYLFSPTIKTLALEHHLVFFKYIVSMNWNFQEYLFGGSSSFLYVDFWFSCINFIIHFLLISILTLFLFKKKNIKNI